MPAPGATWIDTWCCLVAMSGAETLEDVAKDTVDVALAEAQGLLLGVQLCEAQEVRHQPLHLRRRAVVMTPPNSWTSSGLAEPSASASA